MSAGFCSRCPFIGRPLTGAPGHSIYMEPNPPPNLPYFSSPAGAFVQQAHPVNGTGQYVGQKEEGVDMQGFILDRMYGEMTGSGVFNILKGQ